MSRLPVIFWIWLGYIHAVIDLSELDNQEHVRNIKRIPLYANLKELGIDPGPDQEYTLEGDGVHPLPVGLDFQLLSVNGGTFERGLKRAFKGYCFQLSLAMK